MSQQVNAAVLQQNSADSALHHCGELESLSPRLVFVGREPAEAATSTTAAPSAWSDDFSAGSIDGTGGVAFVTPPNLRHQDLREVCYAGPERASNRKVVDTRARRRHLPDPMANETYDERGIA